MPRMVRCLFVTSLWGLAACSGFGAGGSGSGVDLTCEQPERVLQSDGSPSGFEKCNGVTHRVEPATCMRDPPPTSCEPSSPGQASCQSSDECGPNGACLDDGIFDGSGEGCRCVEECRTDADCPTGTVCSCLGGRPQCIGGECSTDADCDGWCITHAYSGACGGTTVTLSCLDPDDECAPVPGSCPEIEDCYGQMRSAPCVRTEDGWRCADFECGTTCG